MKEKTFRAFDYLVVVFLNIGFFSRKKPYAEGIRDPEFYTLPRASIRNNHRLFASGWEKLHTKHLDLTLYKNEKGSSSLRRNF